MGACLGQVSPNPAARKRTRQGRKHVGKIEGCATEKSGAPGRGEGRQGGGGAVIMCVMKGGDGRSKGYLEQGAFGKPSHRSRPMARRKKEQGKGERLQLPINHNLVMYCPKGPLIRGLSKHRGGGTTAGGGEIERNKLVFRGQFHVTAFVGGDYGVRACPRKFASSRASTVS